MNNGNLKDNINSFLGSILNIFFPNRCLFCGSLVEEGSCICDRCISAIEIIETDFCKVCGASISKFDINKSCLQCDGLSFRFRKNESLSEFTGMVRRLIHEYKFNFRKSLSRLFSNLFIRYKKSYILNHDLLIPVPLSRLRFLERGFNQSNLIAEEIARAIPINYYGEILLRKGKSKPQSSIALLKERYSNLRDRFYVKDKFKGLINHSDVLILDDVLTTGATASLCAEALLSCGAKNVDVLSIARTVKEL